ncbi:hypothetical protein GCM10020229_59350 [Kitasatospora albolonga]
MSEQYEYLVRPGATQGPGTGPEHGADPALVLARAELARRQSELLDALLAGAPVSAGFDEGQVRTQARGLLHKRRDTVARVEPELERLLGHEYGRLFLRYAEGRPMTGGYRADARAFAEWALAAEPQAAWRPALERLLRPAGPSRRRWWR